MSISVNFQFRKFRFVYKSHVKVSLHSRRFNVIYKDNTYTLLYLHLILKFESEMRIIPIFVQAS